MSRFIMELRNVLSNHERKYLIKESNKIILSQKTLENMYQGEYPCDQTPSHLHRMDNFSDIHQKILGRVIKETGREFGICRSWVNKLTNKNSPILHMHTHEGSDLSLVYYAKKVPFIHKGTVFKKEGVIESSQNNAILFPSFMEHAVPNIDFPLDRYTLVMELVHV